jgi:ribonuclease HI
VASFLQDRETAVRIGDFTLESSTVSTGIPQGSRVSPILFLFYNADLLDACENISLRTSATGFVDDINILTHSTSTEQNCLSLQRIHLACEEWARRHGAAFDPAKYDLIHFSRAPKRFNMKATLRIDNATLEPKSEIRVLGVQLDPSLRWKPHLRAVEARAVHHLNALKTITGSTWGSSLEAGLKVYTTASIPSLLNGCGTWYSPQGTPEHRKGVAAKLQAIHGRSLRVITGAYRATSTEALEIETFTQPLDLHAETMAAATTYRSLASHTGKAVNSALERIRRQFRGSRGRVATPRATPATHKRRWLESLTGDLSQLEKRNPAVLPPWHAPPDVEIAKTKEDAIKLHDSEARENTLRVYSDGSGLNDRITAAAVGSHKRISKVLGTISDLQVYHGELAGIQLALQLLPNTRDNHTETTRVATIYTDNQAALLSLQGDPKHSQELVTSIREAIDLLGESNTTVRLRWLPGHKGIKGNELADQAAKEAAQSIGPIEKPTTRYLSAIKRLAREKILEKWEQRWTKSPKGRYTAHLTPSPTKETRRLHTGKKKGPSALLTQLRTGKIGFNAFLYNMKVPSVISPRCACDSGTMTVRHVLLTCPTWQELRGRTLNRLNSTDLREILSTPKGVTAAIRFTLLTNLLDQFSLVAQEEQGENERSETPEPPPWDQEEEEEREEEPPTGEG